MIDQFQESESMHNCSEWSGSILYSEEQAELAWYVLYKT